MLSALPTQPVDYPHAPTLSDTQFLDPSPAFRQEVRRTLIGIAGFVCLYILLIGFGIALGYGCLYSAMVLVGYSVNKFTLVGGLGLIALAVMFMVFLVKFLFVVHRNDDGQRVEITAKDHPRLFAFIDQLTDEVKSPKPYRIYLSPNVNACVFYNSSFWSLFFPVRKNLEIGLGLVNSLNMTEFKAVMAHEFGHFSQRSMKLGSYVYVVNRVIYNLVYDRDRWDRLLERWANSGGIWSLFAVLTYWLVNIVRKILVWAYQWLNLRYMGLSREMEYQADLVAVSAAGSESIVTALRRIEFGDTAYQQMLSHLNELVSESKVTKNIYALHTATLHLMAQKQGIDTANGLPLLDDQQAAALASPNRVNYQDQWASHPSQAEREANARSVQTPFVSDESSPWSLLDNPQRWQLRLTDNLYANVEIADKTARQFVNSDEYATYVADQAERAQLPGCYNGFYDGRLLHTFDPAALAQDQTAVLPAADLFSDENRILRKRLFTNYADRNTLQQIQTKQVQTRSFDFDGQKYDRKEAATVLQTLNAEIADQQQHFDQLERAAFRWHYQKAAQQGQANELQQRYELYFRLDSERETYERLLEEYRGLLEQLVSVVKDGKTPKAKHVDQINTIHTIVQGVYAEGQSISIPARIGDSEFPNGYSAHLFPDGPQPVQGEPLVWDDLLALFHQLEQIPHRVAALQIALLNDTVRWQATL